mgnify:CR=1 FL=1
MNMKSIVANVGILAVAAYTVSTLSGAKTHWSYSGNEGPSNWGELDKKYAMCAEGKNQSPIDITQTIATDLNPLIFNQGAAANTFVNNGHTVQANIAKGNSLIVDGSTYNLLQYHFHTPSENVINGKSYPMEMHLVHANSAGNLAVVGVMFDVAKKRNTKMMKILRALPLNAGDENSFEAGVKGYDLLPITQEYYRFNGSLTTPPCSEGVKWFVMKKPVSISDGQLKQVQDVMGTNNRPLQPKNSRAVLR